MTKFVMRTTAPTADIRWYGKENPFFANYSMFKRRLPNLIQGNCTHYTYARFAEMHNNFIKLPTSDGGTWYNKITNLEKGSTPRIGAIIEYKHKNKSGGHLAIVEHEYENGDLLLSMSGLKSYLFKTRVVKKSDNYCYSDYKLVGFIYPTIKFEEDTKPKEEKVTKYTKGTYQVISPRYVRTGAGTEYPIKKYEALSKDGKKHAVNKSKGADAQYEKGTKFTALEIMYASNKSIWANTPSGYVCIESAKGTIYCKKVK